MRALPTLSMRAQRRWSSLTRPRRRGRRKRAEAHRPPCGPTARCPPPLSPPHPVPRPPAHPLPPRGPRRHNPPSLPSTPDRLCSPTRLQALAEVEDRRLPCGRTRRHRREVAAHPGQCGPTSRTRTRPSARPAAAARRLRASRARPLLYGPMRFTTRHAWASVRCRPSRPSLSTRPRRPCLATHAALPPRRLAPHATCSGRLPAPHPSTLPMAGAAAARRMARSLKSTSSSTSLATLSARGRTPR
mmetsp:Transcript_29499/g.80547  ORF Transcript_29499/g.80547 Transcript_29499/m.80547 type:complete len:245 (-) Transcript_29499:2870-3604(-)